MLKFMGRHPTDRRLLIAAVNDTSALDAIAAVRQLRRLRHIAVAFRNAGAVFRLLIHVNDKALALT